VGRPDVIRSPSKGLGTSSEEDHVVRGAAGSMTMKYIKRSSVCCGHAQTTVLIVIL
jgi:hypothetical protein